MIRKGSEKLVQSRKYINTQIKSTRVKANNSDVEICSEILFSKTQHMIPMKFTFVYEFREEIH